MKLRTSTLVKSKILKHFSLFSILCGAVIFLGSCGNNCAQFDCVNGDCVKGTCVCDEGYEGTQCNQGWSSKMIGEYEGRDCYDAENARYAITGLGADTILFDNFFKVGIESSNVLVVPEQEIERDGTTFYVSGSGYYSGDTITLKYTSKYPSFDTRCELLMVKD